MSYLRLSNAPLALFEGPVVDHGFPAHGGLEHDALLASIGLGRRAEPRPSCTTAIGCRQRQRGLLTLVVPAASLASSSSSSTATAVVTAVVVECHRGAKVLADVVSVRLEKEEPATCA